MLPTCRVAPPAEDTKLRQESRLYTVVVKRTVWLRIPPARTTANKYLTFFEIYGIIIIESEGREMKEKFVPYDKLSKKARRELDKQKRKMWDVSPVTKVVPDKHKEKRDKQRFDFS